MNKGVDNLCVNVFQKDDIYGLISYSKQKRFYVRFWHKTDDRIKYVCLCLTSHQQRGHLETAPPFTVPCEGREAR